MQALRHSNCCWTSLWCLHICLKKGWLLKEWRTLKNLILKWLQEDGRYVCVRVHVCVTWQRRGLGLFLAAWQYNYNISTDLPPKVEITSASYGNHLACSLSPYPTQRACVSIKKPRASCIYISSTNLVTLAFWLTSSRPLKCVFGGGESTFTEPSAASSPRSFTECSQPHSSEDFMSVC